MNAVIVEKKERYLVCPRCGNATSHQITDLQLNASFGPSFCLTCGVGIVGHLSHNGAVHIEELSERRSPTYVLLRLVPQHKPIYIVVRDVVFEQSLGAEGSEEDAFFSSYEFLYNHQLCPRVFIRNSVALLIDGDKDSYGLFEYVASCKAQRSDNPDEDEDEIVFRAFGEHLGLTVQSDDDSDLLDSAEETIG